MLWCDYDDSVWERPSPALEDNAPVKARSTAGGKDSVNFDLLISYPLFYFDVQ